MLAADETPSALRSPERPNGPPNAQADMICRCGADGCFSQTIATFGRWIDLCERAGGFDYPFAEARSEIAAWGQRQAAFSRIVLRVINLTVDGPDAGSVMCVHPGWSPLTGRDAVLRSWSMIMANTTYIQFVLTDVVTSTGNFFSTLAGNTALRVVDRAKTAGYTIDVVFVAVPSADLAIGRVAQRTAAGGPFSKFLATKEGVAIVEAMLKIASLVIGAPDALSRKPNASK